jgi:hypothetical protein
MTRAHLHLTLTLAALLLTGLSAAAQADPELCDYQLSVRSSSAPTNVTMPCTLRAVKIASGTTYYKGGWDSSTWQIGGGYVSNPTIAALYAGELGSSNVTVYSARTRNDLYLIDIRDLWTLKALFALPDATSGYAAMKTQNLIFDPDGIDALFGFAVNSFGLVNKMVERCDAKSGTAATKGQPRCYVDEFASIRSSKTRTPYAAYIKYVTELGSATWSQLQGWTLLRYSLFLEDSNRARKVPDTIVMDPLCPYLLSLGFAGWYGAADIPVDVFDGKMAEEYYVCWQPNVFEGHARHAPSAWSTLTATTAAGAASDYHPRGIVRIPTGTSGRTVPATTTVSTTRP